MTDTVSTDLPIPNTAGDNTSPEVPILIDGITVNDFLQKAWRATHKLLFASETEVPIIESIALAETLKECDRRVEHLSLTSDFKPVSFTRDDEGGVSVHFLEEYVRTLRDRLDDYYFRKLVIRGIYKLVFHILTPQFEDDSYPQEFRHGFLDFLLMRERIFPSPFRGRAIAASVWYGPEMPFFLDWVEKEYGEGTIGRLIVAFGAPYNKTGFESVTGTSISNLWKRYHVWRYEESGSKELNAEFSELWPMPILFHDFSRTIKKKWKNMFSSNLEPTSALTRALSAIFKHLYTPKTVLTSPRIFEVFCLVVRSKRMKDPIKFKEYMNGSSRCNVVISWNWIKSEKPTVTTMMEMLVLDMTNLYRLIDPDNIDPEEDTVWSTQALAAFVLIQEGFIPSRIPGEQRSGNNGLESFVKSTITWKDLEIADFFCWIETTVGEGTVKKLYKRASRGRLDPSWLVDPTGKSLRELYYEFEHIFPPREIYVWEESHIDAIYLDDSLEWQESDIDAIYLNELLA